MGKDIIQHYELRQAGRWQLLPPLPAEIDIGRSYDLFALIGDGSRRLTIPSIAGGRGIPADVTPSVRAAWEAVRDDPCITAPSWVGLHELLAFDWDQPLLSDDAPPFPRCSEATAPFAQRTLPALRALAPDPRDLRMVFWFGH